MARTYEVQFRINGALSGQFSAAMRSAQGAMNQLGASARQAAGQMRGGSQALNGYLANLNRLSVQAQKFREARQAVTETWQAYSQQRRKVQELSASYQEQKRQANQMRDALKSLQMALAQNSRQMDSSQRAVFKEQIRQAKTELKEFERGLKETSRALGQAESQQARLASQLSRQKQATTQLAQSLNRAGMSTRHFAQNEARLRQEIQQTTQVLERQQRLSAARENFQQARGNFSGAVGNFDGAVQSAKSMLSPFTSAISLAGDFEKEMSRVSALTGEKKGGEGFDLLKRKAEELGAATEYTALQSAQAMSKLAQSGWGVNQILPAMAGFLDLATASGTALDTTADILSDNLGALGLQAGQTMKVGKNLNREVEASQHLMDVYALATAKSNVKLTDLGETMKYVAPISSAYGARMEDAVAMAMLMGDAGLKNSQAGTSLRMGLLRLSGPTKKSSTEMKALGISMEEANRMAQEADEQLAKVGMTLDKNAPPADKMFQVLSQLSSKMKDLSPEQLIATVSTIFGAEASTGWIKVLQRGPAEFQKIRDMLRDCDGAASEMADTMRDNFNGAMTELDSAVEGVSLAIGNHFLKMGTQAVRAITPLIQQFGIWVKENPQVIQAAGAVTASIAGIGVAAAGIQVISAGGQLAGAGLGYLAKSAETANASMSLFAQNNLTWSALKQKITGVNESLRLFVQRNNSLGAAAGNAVGSVRGLGAAFMSAARGALALVFNPVGLTIAAIAIGGLLIAQNWSTVGPVFSQLGQSLMSTLGGAFSALQGSFSGLWQALQRFSPIFQALGAGFLSMILVIANTVVRTAELIVTAFSSAIKTVADLFSGLSDTIASLLAFDLKGAASHLGNTFSKLGENVKSGVMDSLGAGAKIFTTALDPVDAWQAQRQKQAQIPANAVGQTQSVAPTQPPIQIDASQAQQGLNSTGSAAEGAAQNLGALGSVSESLSQPQQALSEGLTQLNGAVPQATEKITAANGAVEQITPQIQALGETSQTSAGQIQSLGQAAQSATSSFDGLGGALTSLIFALSQKASEIANIHIQAPTVSAAPVAANAEGGIYKKGAFLTTFAEESPEAAIPLDNSPRAKSLWQQAGQALGMLPEKKTEKTFVAQNNKDSKPKIGTQNKPPKIGSQNGQAKPPALSERVLQSKSGKAIESAKTRDNSKSTSIFSKEKIFHQDTPNLGNIFQNSNAGENIFSGKVQLPNLITKTNPETFPTVIFGNERSRAEREGNQQINKLMPGNSLSQQPVSETPSFPPINLTINIQGNADKNTVQTAGEELKINLQRLMADWFRDFTHDRQRVSY